MELDEEIIAKFNELFSILATVEVYCEPGLVEQIREGIEDMKAGRVHSFEEVFGCLL